jgi:hypothetical protein
MQKLKLESERSESKTAGMPRWLRDMTSGPSPLILRASESNDARRQLTMALDGVHKPTRMLVPSTTAPAAGAEIVRHEIGTFSRQDSEFADQVQRTLESGGYEAMVFGNIGQLIRMKALRIEAQDSTPQKDLTPEYLATSRRLTMEADAGAFISTYYRAYFRGGRLAQASLDLEEMVKKFNDGISGVIKKLDEGTKEKLATRLKELLQGGCQSGAATGPCLLTKSLGEQALVTRSGQTIQFAGISVMLGPNGEIAPALQYPKTEEVAPQIVRVFFEAMYDASEPKVPAVSASTACVAGLYSGTECLGEPDTKPPDDKNPSRAERVKWVDEHASKTEATVTAGASKVIRGGSWAALNNEAVAKTVETAAGINSRKIAEKVLWDIQEKCLNDDPKALAGRLAIVAR